MQGIDFLPQFFSTLNTYIEVGANTLKSSSTFQFPTKFMFSFKKITFFFNVRIFLGEQSTQIYNKICTNWIFLNSDWSMFLGKSS